MLASLLDLVVVLAQRGTQEPPEEGVGLGLILLGALIFIGVFSLIGFLFSRASKKARTGAPGDDPHPPGQVGH